ncbi:hypothetical protein [Candidatus Chloroploca asiatica]|uniref:Glycosyl hydrolase 36 catalytic domain-containing protein n=1 Tax=Candidatus Chloroploca asiatica TaxID=1506545 RepID=A0A2H3KM83_9CHLR|nr:hypothetical protein [Candidatus Chloroploca asiatica]PDV99178.1 hypothetical protein A9Q02_13270 [Candidatus Chloroploca asiatica]
MVEVQGDFVEREGLACYRISNIDQMPPFLMSLVGAADHWMFVTSSGGLTAGRVSPDTALFPYETVDRLYDSQAHTGPLTVLAVTRAGDTYLWEPLVRRDQYDDKVVQHLYKDALSTTLVFEAINHALGLAFTMTWQTSPRFGFVRTCRLHELTGAPCTVRLLDGLQNILPHGVTRLTQSQLSNLLDAYKRTVLDPSGLAIFALSSTLTDLAEASESLRATVTWQHGLPNAVTLLSSAQVRAFRRNEPLVPEHDVRGQRGAYLLATTIELAPGTTHTWRVVADVAQDAAAVADLARALRDDPTGLVADLEADIARSRAEVEALVAAADGLQQSADAMTIAHHAANTLFNIMRGGVFADGYRLDADDLRAFMAERSPHLLDQHRAFFMHLPRQLELRDLRRKATASGLPDLERLCTEYLPLTFSRRHGDPSRPWNRFKINIRTHDGRRRLTYEGNWRDLFQNWEPLGYAFPSFLESMVALFLNATTADGYNPYRLARSGVEWEVPEPENPWANIGYWSDHQIIYLLKLLEATERFEPGRLSTLLNRRCYSHVDVPYRIKPYAALLADPTDTIVFDMERERLIEQRVAARGADGKLLPGPDGHVFHVSLAEKLLVLLLAKLVNFVPEGGIWMNTQRPEWNDANNALVGKGLSVVTLAYLRRYLIFCRTLFASGPGDLTVTAEVRSLFDSVFSLLESACLLLPAGFDDTSRRILMDALGTVGEHYREGLYASGLSGAFRLLSRSTVVERLELALAFVEQSLRVNRRDDGLYHSYNLLRLEGDRASIGRLGEMLEGQVAILSSGLLSAEASLALLATLRTSALYRPDQQSYMLYPNRDLPGFLQKNHVAATHVQDLGLVAALEATGDRRLLVRDANGDYHFGGDLRNLRDLQALFDELSRDARFAPAVATDGPRLAALFEEVFRHSEFTGRSGSFFAYEGLGSIYWHMVAKLLLAVQETHARAIAEGADAATINGLAEAYHSVRAGLGFCKDPATYGAFPFDPYSHTPLGRGAQQPGMTGQVKEELLTRMGELGLVVEGGRLTFRPSLLDPAEWGRAASVFNYLDVAGQRCTLSLPADALAFTFCQVPVVYQRGDTPQITLHLTDGTTQTIPGDTLDLATSRSIFERTGKIEAVTVIQP